MVRYLIYMIVILWPNFVGGWKGRCLDGLLRVQDLMVRYLSVKSRNDSYQILQSSHHENQTMQDTCRICAPIN
jgi:hypothetical protein